MTTKAAQAKTLVCQPVYQTGFYTDEKDFDRSWVDSESRGNNSSKDLLPPCLPPSLSQLLSPCNKAVHCGKFFLGFDIRLLATR